MKLIDPNKLDENTINRGKQIYYKNELHYIVYEMDAYSVLISKSQDLEKSFLVKKVDTSVKEKPIVEPKSKKDYPDFKKIQKLKNNKK